MCNAKNHPPGCMCGWGGEGHLGRNDTSNIYRLSLKQRYENFCRPSRCQYCGDTVYFVRYNGGSVWFNSLGKPWPKHECYYKLVSTHAEKRILQGIYKWLG